MNTELLPYEHPLCIEVNVTRLYRAHYRDHPALREVHALRGQYPDALHDVQSGDLLAGRFYVSPNVFAPRYSKALEGDVLKFRIPAVGFTSLRPAHGWSAPWFWDASLWAKKRAAAGTQTPELEAELDELEAFWKTEDPVRRCFKSFDAEVREWCPMNEPLGVDAALPLIRMTGPMLDNRKLTDLGISGLRMEVARRAAQPAPGADPAVYEAMNSALDLAAETARWYAGRVADSALAADLLHIAEHPPVTFRQGAQLILLWGVIATAYQWGRLDDALGPLLAADLAAGRLDEEMATAIIGSLWRIIHDNGAEFDNRVIIGGFGRRNPVEADVFARLAIRATAASGLVLPQLTLRFHEQQDPELYRLSLDAIGRGCTFPMLYNDEVNVPSVMKAFGVSREEAEQYVPYGCGEYVLCNRSIGTPSAALNVTAVLDATLRGGRDGFGRRQCPPGYGLEEMRDFEDLWSRFEDNCAYLLNLLARVQKQQFEFNGAEAGFIHMSLLYDDCIARGRCLFDGGVRYLGGTMESYGQINAADALTAIRRCVFEQKLLTADGLIAALDANFQGYEEVLRLLLAQPAYGNDDAEADAMAARVHEMLCLRTREQAQRVGLNSFLVVLINNLMNTVLGQHTPATPDGRRAGDTLANANNPHPGRDRNGVTAFLSSLVKLDTSIHAGSTQNMKFAKRLFGENRPKLELLLDTYWERGGAQAMITVVDLNTLQDAQRHPEKYPNLIVRVGGFSARFVELWKPVQDEVLARTCHE